MREILTHKVNGCNESLKVMAVDPPGSGGANHLYEIHADESKVTLGDGVTVSVLVEFQNGPIKEVGVNGVTNEALLAIVIDRLQGFQKGQFQCRENAIALTHLEDAMHWLQHRTNERLKRGVEGTHQK
jgi:hypothetical protein